MSSQVGPAGSGGGSGTVSGTTNTVAKFTSSTAVGNSWITDDGTDITVRANGGTASVDSGANSSFLNVTNGFALLEATDATNFAEITLNGGAGKRMDFSIGDGGTFFQPFTGHGFIAEIGDTDGSNNATKGTFDDANKKIILKADNGIAQSAPSSTTAAILANGQISFYLDEVGNALKVAVKYSNGSTKTGSIALT